ncbi:ubiquitin carboxyl-terminal hydrolase 21-like [Vicia villosa]|uniref:ubiquitin carboxyl-terminal hydrolase 21-like n=1 Tax=Vicia villosa TaxID=3911 RepID=UPI00273C5DBB|nr:ubiquitin carboxyl-terminal hydrolase 21-like [Vicia villosa]XP_058721878.1 ubiquitin carboxyl-terminal hydrolase 21-like [Vicia villosa]XP_058721879.1 ubiquitin carboxyl-terminal hydrolase 21-like [Vicia villosa]XP_058721880.1 ubiquitin carboxyl-terminal hydrolase 21-like [Vicia villosa]XP_058721881.1 ubiquitin carboxyl-terminal hydrolase 21-like [Vicia villosa]XP_058721882.1 ubiquitin carboxyl-terminal hydrolase 21-like [Vicia villosa]XP_058721883.1 ubiquitin carboxyl-terminal hydrolase 
MAQDSSKFTDSSKFSREMAQDSSKFTDSSKFSREMAQDSSKFTDSSKFSREMAQDSSKFTDSSKFSREMAQDSSKFTDSSKFSREMAQDSSKFTDSSKFSKNWVFDLRCGKNNLAVTDEDEVPLIEMDYSVSVKGSKNRFLEYLELTRGKDEAMIVEDNLSKDVDELRRKVELLEIENKRLKMQMENFVDRDNYKCQIKPFFQCFNGLMKIIRKKDSQKSKNKGLQQHLKPLSDHCDFVGAGIQNMRSTCFLASALQSLSHTASLYWAINGCSHISEDCNAVGFCVVCSLRNHIVKAMDGSGTVIVPTPFSENLSHFSTDFKLGVEEDVHEFIMLLLQRVGEAFPSEEGNELIKSVFGGSFYNTVVCSYCGNRTEKSDPFLDLSLGIVDRDSLLDSFEAFTSVETVVFEEACGQCGRKVKANKRLLIKEVPNVAIIQLKRFVHVGDISKKVDSFLSFPLELDLAPYTFLNAQNRLPLLFDLFAVVVHEGSSIKTGHYVTFVLSPVGKWSRMNDSLVSDVTAEEVLKEHAYLLFYARRGSPPLMSVLDSIRSFAA